MFSEIASPEKEKEDGDNDGTPLKEGAHAMDFPHDDLDGPSVQNTMYSE